MAKFCDNCGSPIIDGSMPFCPKCGAKLPITTPLQQPTDKQKESQKENSEEKSPFVALLCSFFVPGLGQVYNGETAKGLAIFFGTLIGLFIVVIPGLIVWIYGMYDGYSTAKKMNSGEVIFKPTKTAHLLLFIVLVVFIVALIAVVFAMVLLGSFVSANPTSVNFK